MNTVTLIFPRTTATVWYEGLLTGMLIAPQRITELEKEMSALVRQESRDMLQQAIPVVTMPTWKLLRYTAEADIRNLIVRRTDPGKSPC